MPFRISITVIVILLGASGVSAADGNTTFSAGVSAGARFHYSESSFQLAPGPAVAVVVAPQIPCEFEAKFRAGSLFGYDLTGSVSGRYRFTYGTWVPAAGIQTACSGGFIPYHRSGPDYLIPPSPEWTLGIDLVPLRFRHGTMMLSFCECAIGTDLRYPGRMLILDATLLRFIVRLPAGKRGRQQ